MQTRSTNRTFNTRSLLALLVLTLAVLPEVGAATRKTSGTYVNRRGGQGTYDRSVNRQPGQRQATTTWTRPDGQTGTASTNATRNRQEGSASRSWEANRPNGQTVSGQSSTHRLEDGTRLNERSVTKADGKTATHQAEINREGNTVTRTVTNTGYNGRTETHQTVTTVNPSPAPSAAATPATGE